MPTYSLPLGLIAAILAVVGGVLWYAVAHWPLPRIMTGRLAAVFATGLAGVVVLIWHMGATGDWTPPDTTTTILGALLIPLSAILFAGGEDAPVAAARAARAEHERGVFPLQPAAEAPPRAGIPTWALLVAFVLFGAVIAGCTFAVLQAAGWIRP